jgi:trans-aconitate 2-methyltransferase
VLDHLALRGDETVLDAGCGSGRVTELLVERLPRGRVVALDASQNMLAEARRRLAPAGDRVVYVHADLLDLVPETLRGLAPIDAILSTATFHWVPDHDRLFDNLATVLRPGGMLVAQCGAVGNIERLLTVARAVGVERPGPWVYASVSETRERLRAFGFEAEEVWTHEEPTEFDDARLLIDYLESVCLRQAFDGVPDQERVRLLRAVVDAMPMPVIDYVRLNIVATRAAEGSRR